MVEKELESMRPSLTDEFETSVAFKAAVKLGNAKTIASLLKSHPRLANAQITEAGYDTTALHLAASAGHIQVVRLLIQAGADVNAHDVSDKATPLHWASENGHLDVARALIEAGANVNDNGDSHERGPLGWATCFHDVRRDVAELLIANGARYDIFSAIALGDMDALRGVIAQDPSSLGSRTSKYDGEENPLEFSLKHKERWAAAGVLLESGLTGFDPEDVALLKAVSSSDIDQVEAILARYPHLVRQSRLHPFINAPLGDGGAMLACLLRHGANVNDKSKFGATRLHDAAWSGEVAAANVLLRAGADLGIKDDTYHAEPYGWADFNRQVAMEMFLLLAQLLQQSGLDLNSQTAAGRPLLDLIEARDLAAIRAHSQSLGAGLTIEAMIALDDHNALERRLNADPPVVNDASYKIPPLHQAVRWAMHDIVVLLIDRCADLEAKTTWGSTPLMFAAEGPLRRPRQEDIESIRILLDRGANLEASDDEGRTALYRAANENSLEVARFLLSKGASLTAHDNEGRTPMAVALELGYSEMASLLATAP